MSLSGKYIILDYEGKWKNDVFRMFYHMTNHFVEELGYILIDTSKYDSNNRVSLLSLLSLNESEHRILVIENHDEKLLPDIFTEDLRDSTILKKVKFYLFSDDIHKEKEKKLAIKYFELFEKVFVTYYRPFFEQYPDFSKEFGDRVVWMPHCVSELMKSSMNDKPIQKIGLLGNTAGKVYPNRAFVKELTIDPLFKDKIAEKAHPSKKYKPVDYENGSKLVGQIYFDTLNRFICNFTCSLTLGYTVCKYFEIAYTGSLLLCDPTHDDLSILGFIDMDTCIIYKNRDEIKAEIEWVLDPKNRVKVDEIRKAGFELIRNRHTVFIRCKEIDDIITK